MIGFKIKRAVRNLMKNKVYSVLIIGGFAIGFTACILIGLFYNTEHTVNTGFPHYKQIYRLYDAKQNKCNLDYNLFPVLNEKYPEVEDVCPMEYYSNFEWTIKDPETMDFTRVKYMIATTNSFFRIFSVDVVASLSDKPFNSNHSMVITESVAKRLFGDKNPLGRTISQEFVSGIVSAVIKDLPENSSFHAELLLNAENKEYQMSQACNDGICIYPTNLFLELGKTTDANHFIANLNQTIKQYNTNVDSLSLQKLSDIYLSDFTFNDSQAKGNAKMLVIFLSIAILIILLSSINYLNYIISIQYAKLKEIGINKINGADRLQLIFDSLIEVTLGIGVALIIAALLSTVLMPYTDVLFGRRLHLTGTNVIHLLPAFSGSLVAIILFNSLAPVYLLSRFNITDFLSGGKRRKGRQIGKQTMLTFQLTVSTVLIAVVLVILKQLTFAKHYDLGFNDEHLVRIELPYTYEHQTLLKDEMGKLPFVSGSTLSNGYPGWINLHMGSGDNDNQFMVGCVYVSDDYLKTMGIHLIDGRDFLPGDKDKACIMNQVAVKRYGWKSIGDKKYNHGDGFRVVGMVHDFNVASLHSMIEPIALIYDPDHQFSTLSLRLMPGNVGQQMQQLRKAWKKVLPDEPMEFTFYDTQFQAMYTKEEKLAKSIAFFSFIAIVLTCMGILGQIFMISMNRSKEIGIRKVNGARVAEVVMLLNRNFVKWVGIALVLATPVAWVSMHKWLENFAYKTTLSWWIFVLAGLMTLGITLLTVSWQSWRAATKNPVEALRYE